MPDNTINERRPHAAQVYFRDEMRRAVAWRSRLDRTSNWAVVMTATLLTWVFSKPENPHFVLLVAILTVAFFLVLEANRYRRYDVWRSRLRLIEGEILAKVFRGQDCCEAEVWERLASDLISPSLKIPWLEAIQRRLRRVYAGLFCLLLLAWTLKLSAFRGDGGTLERAAIGEIPGAAVLGVVSLFVASMVLIVGWPIKRRAMEGLSEEDIRDPDWQD